MSTIQTIQRTKAIDLQMLVHHSFWNYLNLYFPSPTLGKLVDIALVAFRCTNGDFYVALGSSMGLALLVWVGGGLLKQLLYFFGNEPSLCRKSLILHLPYWLYLLVLLLLFLYLLVSALLRVWNAMSIFSLPFFTRGKERIAWSETSSRTNYI